MTDPIRPNPDLLGLKADNYESRRHGQMRNLQRVASPSAVLIREFLKAMPDKFTFEVSVDGEEVKRMTVKFDLVNDVLLSECLKAMKQK